MYKRIHVIVNPAAGRDVPILGTLNKRFAEAGIDWDIFVTKEAGDARRLAKEAVAAGADAVAVNGGDGTLMEVADGLRGSKVPLAILPGGTANVMSIELAIPNDLTAACELLCGADSAVRAIDMGQIGRRYFLLRVGMGLEASMVVGADRELKNRMGSLAYVLSGLQALREQPQAHYRLVLDGYEVEVEGITCMVANSGSLGTQGLRLAPNIDVSDGLLDVVVIRSGDLGSILSVLASVVAGNENAEPLQHWQARKIQIEAEPSQPLQVDGEILHQKSVNIRVVPHSLNVIVPKPKPSLESVQSRVNADYVPGAFGAATPA
jgi:diacylglycerol kinase (ATP)